MEPSTQTATVQTALSVSQPTNLVDKLTMSEVAKLLGKSRTTVRTLAERGQLTATRSADGIFLFNRAQVEQFATAYAVRKTTTTTTVLRPGDFSGADAAIVYGALDDGESQTEIVKRTRLHPFAVESIAQVWARTRRMILVDEANSTTLRDAFTRALPKREPVTDGRSVVDALFALLDSTISQREFEKRCQCEGCRIFRPGATPNRALYCAPCVKSHARMKRGGSFLNTEDSNG